MSVARPGRLLGTIARGVGCRSCILADRVPDSTALVVDISHSAIEYATRKYAKANVSYLCCDATAFRDAEGFDTIVSLETIEHVPTPGQADRESRGPASERRRASCLGPEYPPSMPTRITFMNYRKFFQTAFQDSRSFGARMLSAASDTGNGFSGASKCRQSADSFAKSGELG